jgi:TonB-linked SusC/RagA family outer membrane protein
MKVMKVTAFIMLVCCLHASAWTAAQTVSISGKDLSLSKVFSMIKKQTGYAVFGNASLLKKANHVSISVSNMALTTFLDSVLKRQPISYRILERTIILSPKEPSAGAVIMPGNKTTDDPTEEEMVRQLITGYVVAERDSVLEGVSVRVKGTSIGVYTDAKGKYTLNAEANQILIFSHVSMTTREIRVSELPANGKVVLKLRDATLSDIVVTGYGNIRKESFTGTYTQVTKADIQRVSPNNLVAALQTFDPSFRIMQNINMGSNPNVMPEFYIRGQSGFPGVKELDRLESGSDVSQFSLKNNPNTPIFIMDGFEITVEKMYDMDINRINNVTILKDAAATAMYGSRASNGVVIIETIAPKPGEFRVTYNGNYSITAPDLSSYNMMNAQEKLDVENAAGIYLPTIPQTDPYYKTTLVENLWYQEQKKNEIRKGVNTYWLSQPLSTMFNSRHNVYVEGGSQAMRVGLELKYDKQNGVMKESFRDRISAGLTLQYQTRNLQFRNQVYYDEVKADESPYGKFSDYSRLQPYYRLRDETTGEYVKTFPNYFGRSDLNPLYESTVGNFNQTRYKEFTDNFTANWYLTKFLFIRGQLAIDYKDANTDVFTSPTSAIYSRGNLFSKGDLSQSNTKRLDWNTNLFASYNRNIDDNNINVSLGINANATKEEYITSAYRGFPSASFHSPSYAYEIVRKPTLSDNKRALFGSFATVNYSYKDIYLFDGSFRMDGSSEFGTDKKWAPFWSVGTGINLHKTHFFKTNNNVDMFRITANIGQTGKSNFSPFMARNTYEVMLDDWYPTGIGASLVYMGNKNLTWEKQVSWNIGTMISLLKRITFEFNYYNKSTYDLITDVSLPSSAGFTIYRDNIGKVLNKGFEIKLTGTAINTPDFSLTLNANMAHNKNSIVEIAQSMKRYNSRIDEYYKGYLGTSDPVFGLIFNDLNAKFAKPIMKYEEGSSLTTIYGMKSLGINPANGKEVFEKRDGTITYDWDPTEQQPIGNTEPWAQGAFGINARYKRFTLYTTFLYEAGGEQYNNTMVSNVENVNLQYYNADKRVISDRWQKPGDKTPLKGLQDRYLITRPTSRFIQKNNYISFNSLSLGYEFDPAFLKRFRLKFLRTSLMMNDVALFSTVKREMGLDYPYARTFTFMINASF